MMNATRPPYRRTIDEPITRYQLEPTLVDIFVEGPSDVQFITWFMGEHHRVWLVYEIDTVDVPPSLVHAAGYEVGARGRILTLCKEIESQLGASMGQKPIFIADRDFDHVLRSGPYSYSQLILTDYSSMELYGYNERALGKLLRVVLGVAINPQDVINALTTCLIDLFLLRSALKKGKYGIGVIARIQDCLSHRKGQLCLDIEGLAARSISGAHLAKGSPRPRTEEIVQQTESLRPATLPDPKMIIRGHDFIRILTWYLKPYVRITQFHVDEAIQRALMGCIELADLNGHSLFSELLRRTTARSHSS